MKACEQSERVGAAQSIEGLRSPVDDAQRRQRRQRARRRPRRLVVVALGRDRRVPVHAASTNRVGRRRRRRRRLERQRRRRRWRVALLPCCCRFVLGLLLGVVVVVKQLVGRERAAVLVVVVLLLSGCDVLGGFRNLSPLRLGCDGGRLRSRSVRGSSCAVVLRARRLLGKVSCLRRRVLWTLRRRARGLLRRRGRLGQDVDSVRG
mmetsp:Transcript_15466/g.62233  ORF Transcript_15466/g.62233 Transcript_15466/m.62233 type:complete len:206 (+) Transcript_15466:2399-3016(+)